MKWWDRLKTAPPLLLAVFFIGSASIALEREQLDGAAALASVGFLLIGVWIAVHLHSLWADDHHGRKDRKDRKDRKGDE